MQLKNTHTVVDVTQHTNTIERQQDNIRKDFEAAEETHAALIYVAIQSVFLYHIHSLQ